MPIRLSFGLLLGVIFCADAATHSAWSAPIPWDIVTAVQTPIIARTAPHPGSLIVSPNPASPGQPILFTSGSGTIDKIDHYDALGKFVASVRAKSSGPVGWNQRDDKGALFAPGVFFARCTINNSVLEKQLVIGR
jgi:hypothetical protein